MLIVACVRDMRWFLRICFGVLFSGGLHLFICVLILFPGCLCVCCLFGILGFG